MKYQSNSSGGYSWRSVFSWYCGGCGVLVLCMGCHSVPASSEGDPPQLVDGSKAYTGPAIGHEIDRARHVFIVKTPTGGWDVLVDREEQIGPEGRVFLTLIRPGRGEMVTQAVVEHLVQTDLPADRVVSVYACVMERARETEDAGYALVRRIEP